MLTAFSQGSPPRVPVIGISGRRRGDKKQLVWPKVKFHILRNWKLNFIFDIWEKFDFVQSQGGEGEWGRCNFCHSLTFEGQVVSQVLFFSSFLFFFFFFALLNVDGWCLVGCIYSCLLATLSVASELPISGENKALVIKRSNQSLATISPGQALVIRLSDQLLSVGKSSVQSQMMNQSKSLGYSTWS